MVDGLRTIKFTKLEMVPCSEEADKFFQPNSPSEEFLLRRLPYAKCIKNSEDITFYGNSKKENNQGLDIKLVRCTNRPTCKNETEINDFIDKHGAI